MMKMYQLRHVIVCLPFSVVKILK